MATAEGRASSGRLTKRALLIALGLLAVGALVVYFGAELGGLSEYERSIFLNVGTALGLISPLFLAERLLSAGIGDVRERAERARATAEAAQTAAAQTQTGLAELTRQFEERLTERRAEDDRLRRRFIETQSQADLVDLYWRAAKNHSIDRRGLRVAPGRLDYWILVRAVDRSPEGKPISLIELTFENAGLTPLGETVVWSPEEPAAEVLVRLASELQGAGEWPGDDAFRPAEILKTIADALGRVIDIRTGPRGDRDVRQIIELVGDWAITREGLDSILSSNAWAEDDELVGDSRHAFHRLQQQTRAMGWSDWGFRQAFGIAEKIHAALKKESPGRAPPI
jgi:hypothetical protein